MELLILELIPSSWPARRRLLAPFGHAEAVVTCLLLGEERT
jgi:hypothetical protein